MQTNMNNQPLSGVFFNASVEQLEEQILRHQMQIRALHFEIARRQMQQASHTSILTADLSQGSQGMRSPSQSNLFDQQTSDLVENAIRSDPFQQPPAQQNPTLTPLNNLNQHGRGSLVKSTPQSGFGKASPKRKAFGETIVRKNPFGHPSQSSLSFGQAKMFDSKQSRQNKRSFGHSSQNSFVVEARQQQSNEYARQTAPLNSNLSTSSGRMLNKIGKFLGRVQSVPTEGFAVSIKRLGKAKFFDYKTVEECLQEWESK